MWYCFAFISDIKALSELLFLVSKAKATAKAKAKSSAMRYLSCLPVPDDSVLSLLLYNTTWHRYKCTSVCMCVCI